MKGGVLGRPVGLAPEAAVEVAAGMARYVMSFEMGVPDIAEALADLVVALGEADIGFSAFLVRRLIGLFAASFIRKVQERK